MRPAEIENISDTALWVAIYRAIETERPDAHFRDPYARALAGERGAAIMRGLPGARSATWAMVVRTAVIDELILRIVRESGADAVLNLAAGLDTRPYRLTLPSSLRWIEVDLPGILSYKEEKLAGAHPVCAVESVKLDLSDAAARRQLFARIGSSSRAVLTVTEGLLVYLTSEQVGSLASDLHAHGGFRWWIIDVVSPTLLRMLQRKFGRSVAAGQAKFQFAPEEGTEFFRKYGWRTAEFRSTFEEAHRLKREMRLAWLWRLVARLSSKERQEKFRRMGGIALLERI